MKNWKKAKKILSLATVLAMLLSLIPSALAASYSAVTTISSSTTSSGQSYSSTSAPENAILVTGGASTLTNPTVTKSGSPSGNSDDYDFYGTNAAIVATEGTLNISGGTVTTSGSYANAVYAHDSGVINVEGTAITTSSNNSGGIMVTGGGTLTATDVTVTTSGGSSASIRSDKGGGTMTVTGGSFTTSGQGSPAIYSTADITVSGAELTAEKSEGIVIEGGNSVEISDVTLTDTNNTLNGQSTTYKNIFLYQSMSGDASSGASSFKATDSAITTNQGDTFYATNITTTITLENNTIENNNSDSGNGGYFLRAKADSWGSSGSNGGNVTLNMTNQNADGDIYIDSISTLSMNLSNGSAYSGTINGDNTASSIALTLDADSTLSLTGNSYVTSLSNGDSDNSNITLNGYSLYVNGTAITVSDSGDNTDTLTFTDSSAYDIPASTVGTAITSIDVSGGVSGGTSPYTFSAAGLPDGISISTAGVISGTPTTAADAATATITVTDSASVSDSIEITVGAISAASTGDTLTFTDSSAYDIPASTVGTAITSIDVSGGVSGGTSPYTFSATGLPDGISISTAGVISGTPTTAASASTATVTVTDSASTPAEASIEISVGTVTAASSGDTDSTDTETTYNLSENGTISISEDGTYTITGTTTDGSITVKKGVTATLNLTDASVTSATDGSAPLTCNKGSNVTLVISGTVTLTDDEDPDNSDSEGAAIKVKAGGTLTISGSGTLNVNGNCKNGIKGVGASYEDDGTLEYSGTKVNIAGATVNVTAENNGVACDNAVEITGGTLNITAGNDGIKAEPDEEDTDSEGTVTISSGSITISTNGTDGGDGVQATGDLTISGGTLNVTTMDGYNSGTFDEDTMSAKGLKSDSDILISGGTFTLNCADDAVHADGNVTISDGTFTNIQSGDDGIHADYVLTIGAQGASNGPSITISQSVEGLEGATVNLYSGSADVTASDDGVNAANSDLSDYTYNLNIAGGTWIVNAGADCLDSNGNLTVSGGETVLYGPLSQPEVVLDYVNSFTVSGGTILAIGQTSITDSAEAGSSTTVVGVQFNGVSISNGTAIEVRDSSGNTVASATGRKSASTVFYTDSSITDGDSYSLLLNGASVSTASASALTSGGPGGDNPGGGPGGDNPGGGPGGDNPGGGPGGEPPALAMFDSDSYDIPASTVHTAISSVDISGAARGGTPPYTFSATGLPDGITISTAGVISGTPTTAASASTATVTVTDSASPAYTASMEIAVGAISSAASDETGYEVSVTGGSGSGTYTQGTSVTINADDAPSGKVFDKWTGTTDGLVFTSGSLNSSTATFTMPGNQVNLTATYRTSQGCYVATAVYGSYDCPEVWTLRRFRDKVLAKTWYGRLFIHLYYAVSPTAVKLFGQTEWFQNFFRNRLDPWVADLQANGFESTPYNDRAW